MSKVPQYTKDAINRYNAKFDRVSINLPKGTKEKIAEKTNMSCNSYIKSLVLANLTGTGDEQPAQSPLQVDNLPWQGGECIKFQMTAEFRDKILQFTDDISGYIKNAVCGRLNFDRQNAQNAQISHEKALNDNLSMQEEKTLKTANNGDAPQGVQGVRVDDGPFPAMLEDDEDEPLPFD